MKFRSAHIVLLVLVAMLVVACANIGSPDGGPYDETPPKIVSSSPKYGATGSKATKIVLEFDENIKVEDASEKVIVSPPQIEQPEINASGKRITVELMDSIKPGLTYTIDFADAIEDNNEGNPMGDYAFTFSTGDKIDTMQVSGYVLDASNLEPIKGIFVGLYAVDSLTGELPDSVFKTKPFERISRTDSRGHFVVKGIAPGEYRAFALQDQDQTYTFNQKSEMIGFNDKLIKPSFKPDIRYDTIWHDSIHYDSIVPKRYTHFYPDDIVLLAFKEKITDRYFLKMERPNLRQFTLYFTSASDQLPVIEGLNFNADNAFVVENNPTNDTILYWIKDSLVYNLDTLEMNLSYMATDSTGNLVLQTDSAVQLVSKISKAKYDKELQQEYDEWLKEYKDEWKREQRQRKEQEEEAAAEDSEGKKSKSKKKSKVDEDEMVVPPMPEKFLQLKISPTSLDPDKNVNIEVPEPVQSFDLSAVHFYERVDSVREKRDFILQELEGKHNTYRLYAEWQPGHSYELEIDTGAVASVYGNRIESSRQNIKVKSLDVYSTLYVNLVGADTCAVVQLMDGSDKVVKTLKAEDGKADFYFIMPGTYYLRMYYDRNGNGKWDEGNYDEHLQAEDMFYYPRGMNLKANWEVNQTWNPNDTPRFRQKPEKITKQKAENVKKLKSKNAQRMAEKNKSNNGKTSASRQVSTF